MQTMRMSQSSPASAQSQQMAVTGAGIRIALTDPVAGIEREFIITNEGTADADVAWGNAAITCTTANGYPILARSKEAVSLPAGTTHIYAIAASGTTSLIITPSVG